MSAALLVVLLLHPALQEEADVRLVASGVGGHDVQWEHDGRVIARTGDREAATVRLPAGESELVARSAASTPWHAVARLEGHQPGAAFVEAWSAAHAPAAQDEGPTGAARAGQPPMLPIGLATLAAVLLAWPRRRPAAWRKGKRSARRDEDVATKGP